MESKGEITGRVVRVIALCGLLLGLVDAARVTGLWDGSANPILVLGPAGFVYTAAAALTLLFAAVGLWMRASWGAVLLLGALGTQIVLYLIGNPDVSLSMIDFGLRLVVLIGMVLVLLARVRLRRLSAHD